MHYWRNRMSCAMEYQQLAPPPLPGVLHQAHHPQQHQPPGPQPHPHIVVAPAHQQQSQPPPPPLPPASHAHQVHAPLPSIHADSASSRWNQYQHLWRQHPMYINGTILFLGYMLYLEEYHSDLEHETAIYCFCNWMSNWMFC